MIDPTNRNSALASALVEELGRSGVRDAVLSPGSRSTPIALALDARPGIRVRVVLDERSAGFVALGTALATGRPAIVACTSGSAAANLHPAIVEADEAGVPMIVLTSDRPPELRGIGAGQTVDQIKLYGSAVRWFCEAGTHEADDTGLLHYRSLGCRGYAEAQDGRGPVHLNLAWRDPLGPEPGPEDVTASDPLALSGRRDERPLTTSVRTRTPDTDLASAVANALDAAERPLIVAGRDPWSRLAPALATLSERASAPILAEPTSQLRFGPHDRSGVITTYDAIVRELPERLDPDLVVRFGEMPTSKPLRQWLAAEAAPDQIVIDPPGRWNEPSRRAGAILRTDPLDLTAALCQSVGGGDEEWRAAWVGAELAAQEAIAAVLDGGDLTEPGLMRALGDSLADGDRVLLASSMPIRDGESCLAGGLARALLFSNRGANGIDGLVATTTGLSTGSGGRTIAVLGDLALAHDLGGIATLAEADGDVSLLVIDNGGGHIFDFLPQADQVERERFERLFITPSGLDLERVAGLFDLAYTPIAEASVDELAAMRRADRVLAHVRIPPDDNVELHRRLAAAVAEAVASRT